MTLFAVSWFSAPAVASQLRRRLCAIGAAAAIATLTSCTTQDEVRHAAPPPMVAPKAEMPSATVSEQRNYYRLPGMPAGVEPIRVGVILPFSNGAVATRKLATSMMNAAEMALYDSNNRSILLMTADEGGGGPEAAEAARELIAKGAEIIIGPLFAPSVSAVASVARAKGIPVIAFSTDRTVAGNGVYLLSFQPENEVRRVVTYAAGHGHTAFAAIVPQSPYGDHIAAAMRTDVASISGRVTAIERFNAQTGDMSGAAKAVAAGHPDTVMIAQGGALLRAIGPTLAVNNLANGKVQLLGSGLWNDRSIAGEPSLLGGWFGAPAPGADEGFAVHYQQMFGERPAQLTTLTYDAVALAALLSGGSPFQRFTKTAITDPNGFAGVTGIFRFDPDGSCERGLAVLSVGNDGFHVVDPAPVTFQKRGT